MVSQLQIFKVGTVWTANVQGLASGHTECFILPRGKCLLRKTHFHSWEFYLRVDLFSAFYAHTISYQQICPGMSWGTHCKVLHQTGFKRITPQNEHLKPWQPPRATTGSSHRRTVLPAPVLQWCGLCTHWLSSKFLRECGREA